jgi:DNA-binding IclR family transcriptional regulator
MADLGGSRPKILHGLAILVANRGRPRGTAEGTVAKSARRDTVGAVEHAVALLRCLSEAGNSLGTNEIARRIGLHKSSVSRLAGTLERARLVQRHADTGQLSLGIGLVALAAPVLASFAVRDLVRPLLKDLAARTGETASFCIWDGREAVSIEQVPGSISIQALSRPGHRDPGHATASGKVLLAHLGDAVIDDYCRQPLHRFTDRTLTDRAALLAELAHCRVQGYAINTGELERDVGAVAAIVLDAQARPLGAVTAAVPMYRFDTARRSALTEAVTACARELAKGVGDVQATLSPAAATHPSAVPR